MNRVTSLMAAAVLGVGLSACNDTVPTPTKDVLAKMAEQPEGSFTVLPWLDDKGKATGKFVVLIRRGQSNYPSAFTAEGVKGRVNLTQFFAAEATMGDHGRLNLIYGASTGGCNNTKPRPITEEEVTNGMIKSLVMSVEKIDDRKPCVDSSSAIWALRGRYVTHENFTMDVR